ncbi:MAG: response regulator [Desulfobacterales bacterium]
MKNVLPNNLKRPHILIVDDDFWVVDVMVDFVSDIMGCEGHGVYSAEDAIAHIRRYGDIDLVITDIHMMGMDGLDLTEVIRKEYKSKVIVMSGIKYRGAGKEAINAGASDFFSKPINLGRLKVMIESVLEPV